jgi:CubicO group peptidase (beta-lactamase class C family)
MHRRTFIGCGLSMAFTSPLLAAFEQRKFDQAVEVLAGAVDRRQVRAAVIHVRDKRVDLSKALGTDTVNARFLLGSISKPICMAALMSLYDRGDFRLEDPVKKFVPAFKGEGREAVTIRHLLTHTCGLPDQLAANMELRKKHAALSEFVDHTVRTPLEFAPGSRYQYSSMGILLAAHIAEVITRMDIRELVEKAVFAPLKMENSAQGLGRFRLEDFVGCQTEGAAPESGAGDPGAKDWNWNSPYWRKLGAPWGGTHCSAPDVGRFLAEFLHAEGKAVKPETARLMTRNHNPAGLTPRGLGFGVGVGSPGCSANTFGHTGSTGTLCWADPEQELICVVLTSLPARAAQPHPRDLAAAKISS